MEIASAAPLFPPRDGKPPHIGTLYRRIRYSVNGVRLKAVKHSGRWYTTERWVQQYVEEYTKRAIVPTRDEREAEIEQDSSQHIERAKESLSRRWRRGKGQMPAL